jgi:hypothetical protein
MFKKLKFWFDFIKRVIEGYEATVDIHGYSPLADKRSVKGKPNVQSSKTK